MESPSTMPEECVLKLKSKFQAIHSLLTTEVHHIQPSVGNILHDEDYSSLHHLLRVTAYVVRAIKKFKCICQDNVLSLSPTELADAERLWLLCA